MSMSSCLFQDLGSSDLRKDVYIVVHIIRIGGSYYAASLLYQALHVFLNLLGFRSSSVVTVGVFGFICLVFLCARVCREDGSGREEESVQRAVQAAFRLCRRQHRRSPHGRLQGRSPAQSLCVSRVSDFIMSVT